MALRVRIWGVLILWAGVVLSCGIKGPPLPPMEEAVIQSQLATQLPVAIISADSTKSNAQEKKQK